MSARTRSSRARGVGTPGSSAACRSSSQMAIETPSPSGTCSRGLGEQRDVAAQQRALGEDGERRARVGQRADDPGHEPVPALGALVRVGVRAQRDVLRASTTGRASSRRSTSHRFVFTTIWVSKSRPESNSSHSCVFRAKQYTHA